MSKKRKIGFDIEPNKSIALVTTTDYSLEMLIKMLEHLKDKKGECKHCKKVNDVLPVGYDIIDFNYVLIHINCDRCKHQSIYVVKYKS